MADCSLVQIWFPNHFYLFHPKNEEKEEKLIKNVYHMILTSSQSENPSFAVKNLQHVSLDHNFLHCSFPPNWNQTESCHVHDDNERLFLGFLFYIYFYFVNANFSKFTFIQNIAYSSTYSKLPGLIS